MVWICANCSTSNDDTLDKCFVCGAERSTSERSTAVWPTSERSTAEIPIHGKICFSDYEAFVDSLNYFLDSISSKSDSDVSASRGTSGSDPRINTSRSGPIETPSRTTGDTSRTETTTTSGRGFAEPWSDHKIKFDIDKIKSKGYVGLEQKVMGGVKGYSFYKADGSTQFIRVEMILIQKMAYKV